MRAIESRSTQPEPSMIAVQDLVKEHGRFRAVDGVTLAVKPGEIHGFLGPNGAGRPRRCG